MRESLVIILEADDQVPLELVEAIEDHPEEAF
jgi:hypothetical protein